jgi:hypothetical protein
MLYVCHSETQTGLTTMPTVRELVAEFNALATQARAQGINNADTKHRNSPYKNITVGQKRLAKLRALLASSGAPAAYDAAIATQTFGPELEVIMPRGMTREDLAQAITAAGVTCFVSSRQHGHEPTWTVVYDGSLPHRGAEVRAPSINPLQGTDGLEQLRKVCDAMKAAGCTAKSKRCGFHVHVGARAESVGFFRQLALVYKKFEPAIDSLVAHDRRGRAAYFAQPHNINHAALAAATTINDVMAACGQGYGGRYFKLNFASFDRHGTVEFRQHHGTVDSAEAIAWVKLCLRMTACAKVASSLEGDPTLAELFAKAAVPVEEQAFLTARAEALARQAERIAARRTTRLARMAAQRAQRAQEREVRYQQWLNRPRNTVE